MQLESPSSFITAKSVRPIRSSSDKPICVQVLKLPTMSTPEAASDAYRLIFPMTDEPVHLDLTQHGRTETHVLQKNDLVVVPNGIAAAFQWSAQIRAVQVRILPKTLQNFAAGELGLIADPETLTGCTIVQDPALFDIATRLGDAAADGEIGAPVLIEAWSRALLVTILRNYAQRRATGVDPSSGLSPDQYRRILDYARRHLSHRITSECLAKAAGMSVSSFTRALRATRSETPQKFIMKLRIEHAEELLADTQKPLGTVAFECGFSDQAHFSRSFRHVVGMPPSEWRRNAHAARSASH